MLSSLPCFYVFCWSAIPTSCYILMFVFFLFLLLQVATALLVAGSTLTFWIPWQTPFASTSSYSSVVPPANLWLVPINAHVTWWYAVQLIEPWRPRRRQNIIAALTTLPQGWVSARKHQCTTAITTIWTKSSWAFPESYTANDSSIMRSSDGGHGETKGLITPPPRWVSAQLLCVCVTAW